MAVIAFSAMLWLSAPGAFCQQPAGSEQATVPDSLIHAIDSSTYRIGNVIIDRTACPVLVVK